MLTGSCALQYVLYTAPVVPDSVGCQHRQHLVYAVRACVAVACDSDNKLGAGSVGLQDLIALVR